MKQFVIAESCIKHHSSLETKIGELTHTFELRTSEQNVKLGAIEERMDAFEKRLAGNGNFDVGKKIDELTKLVKKAIRNQSEDE